jgi:outer membrane receptor protein involved in Fe transport
VVYNRRKASVRYHTSYAIPFGADELTLTGGGDYASHSLVGLTSYLLPSNVHPTGTYDNLSGSRSVQTFAGAFAQGQLNLHDRLFFTLGAHGDMSEGQSGVAWSPRLGASYSQPLGDVELKMRVAYGSALIAPDPSNKQGFASDAYIIRANPDLKPERQAGYDAGIELFWGNRGSLTLTYFDQKAKDLVALTFLEYTPNQPAVYQYQNVGRIHNRGWEATATFVPTASLQLTGVFGSTKSTVESLADGYTGPLAPGDEVQRVPDWTAGATLAWRPFGSTTLNAHLTHRASWIESDFEARFGALIDGSFTGNPKDYWIDYQPVTKLGLGLVQRLSPSTSGFVRVENLTNNYNFEGHDLIDPRGREMQAGLRFRFN